MRLDSSARQLPDRALSNSIAEWPRQRTRTLLFHHLRSGVLLPSYIYSVVLYPLSYPVLTSGAGFEPALLMRLPFRHHVVRVSGTRTHTSVARHHWWKLRHCHNSIQHATTPALWCFKKHASGLPSTDNLHLAVKQAFAPLKSWRRPKRKNFFKCPCC